MNYKTYNDLNNEGGEGYVPPTRKQEAEDEEYREWVGEQKRKQAEYVAREVARARREERE